MARRVSIVALVLIALGMLAWPSVYVLDEAHLGWLSGGTCGTGFAVVEPGLHLKWPWQSLCRFSRQIQWRELGPAERTTASGGSVILTATAFWRLTPEGLARRVQLAQNDDALGAQIASVVSEGLDREVSQHPLTQFLADGNTAEAGPQDLCLGQSVRAERAAWIMERYGLELLDVAVTRVALTPAGQANRREQKTSQLQAEVEGIALAASKQADEVRAKAEADAQQIKTKAEADAGTIRANGQARAAKLIADARRPELESLLKVIEGYRVGLDKDTTLVLEGGKEFFRLIEGVSPAESDHAAQTHPASPTEE